jgi:hypothetical protein
VIDNASKDGTLARCQSKDIDIVVIENRENLGVAEGNNQGIRTAISDGCEYVLLINNDTEFEAFLIEKLLDGICRYSCAAVVPKMMYFTEKEKIWFAGGGFIEWKGYSNYHTGIGEKDLGQHDMTRVITYAPTCCVLLKKNVFDLVGLMDQKYFVYFDDADFFYRLLKNQLVTYYLPNFSFYHKVSSLTGGVESKFTTRYMIRNKVYFIIKQRSFFTPILLLLFFVKTNLDFLFTKRFSKNFENFKLIQASFFEGILL